MATLELPDVKTDADYIALRRRMSRLRVQNTRGGDDNDDDDDDLSDEMLNDLIKFWKKNDSSIAKRFIQTKKERKAKEKAAKMEPGTSGRRKSLEFEDLDLTKRGLRLKSHEPLHLTKSLKSRVQIPDCTGSDETLETLSVRRPLKTSNQQKMDMILNRANAKTDMCKAEEHIIKSKLESASKNHPPRVNSPFRPRVDSNSSDKFRSRSGSESKKDCKRRIDTSSEKFRQRSDSESSKNRPVIRKSCTKHPLVKQLSTPIGTVTKS